MVPRDAVGDELTRSGDGRFWVGCAHRNDTWDPALPGRERSLEGAMGNVRVGRSGAPAPKLDAMGVSPKQGEWPEIERRVRSLVEERDLASESDIEGVINEVVGK